MKISLVNKVKMQNDIPTLQRKFIETKSIVKIKVAIGTIIFSLALLNSLSSKDNVILSNTTNIPFYLISTYEYISAMRSNDYKKLLKEEIKLRNHN